MKPVLLFLTLISVAAFAADKKPAQKNTTTPPAKKIQEITIPAGAVETEPFTYHYTDPQGKKWIYRKTPFGVSRVEDKPIPAADAEKAQKERERLIQATTAVEDGGTIRFERTTPFGPMKWQRKKSELNEVERAVWDRESTKRAARESASKD
ncbi:MAG TPA: hypothetical protein VJN43_15310 [Bryobacteraceae bacterium]|nr:hypothetical protein [Bryobacteraceae bacterium]